MPQNSVQNLGKRTRKEGSPKRIKLEFAVCNTYTLVVVLVVGLSLIACVKIFGSKSESAKERSEKAHALVAAGATLLDVRTPQEYAAGHAEGAINIPFDQLSSRLAEVAKDKKVVVYCQSGRRSGIAASTLKQNNYEVFDLQRYSDW